MDQEEKEYIDKKFEQIYTKLIHPDPELIREYRIKMYKRIIPWVVVGMILVFGTMIISFFTFGLF